MKTMTIGSSFCSLKGQGASERGRGGNRLLRVVGLLVVTSLFSIFGACHASQKDPDVPENFVFIRGGEFTMGSPDGEVGSAEARAFWQQNFGIDYSETQHQVKVSDFAMSKYSVTVGEFRRFVKATGYKTDAEREGFSSFVYFGNNTAGFKNNVNWRHGVRGVLRPSSEEKHPVLYAQLAQNAQGVVHASRDLRD